MNRIQKIEMEALKLLNAPHTYVDMSALRAAVDIEEAPWQAVLNGFAELEPEERSRVLEGAKSMWPPAEKK